MQKPAIGLLYAILIIVGILAVAAWNHMMGSDEGSTQATQIRNAATARGSAEPDKAATDDKAEPTPAVKESPDAPGDKAAEKDAAKDEEKR